MSGMYGGFSDLGAMLAGGDASTKQQAFYTGAKQRISLEDALLTAKKKRDEDLARENRRQALRDAMPKADEGTINLLDTVMGAGEGSDFNASVQGLGHLQQNDARSQALALPQPGTPDYSPTTPDLFNTLQAVATSKMLTPNNVEVIPQADAKIGSEHARAEASHARAKATSDVAGATVDYKHAQRDNVGKPKGKAAEADDGKFPSKPETGKVYNGYRYKGGDPKKASSWTKEK